jgi:hypothetical protein
MLWNLLAEHTSQNSLGKKADRSVYLTHVNVNAVALAMLQTSVGGF